MEKSRGNPRRAGAVVVYVLTWFASARAGDAPFVFSAHHAPHEGGIAWSTTDDGGTHPRWGERDGGLAPFTPPSRSRARPTRAVDVGWLRVRRRRRAARTDS